MIKKFKMKIFPLKYVLDETSYVFGMHFTIEHPKNNAHSVEIPCYKDFRCINVISNYKIIMKVFLETNKKLKNTILN